MRLLLIEDSRRLQKSLLSGLRAAAYAVDPAGDGEEGLALAASHAYDVIILDLMLPKIDGFTVLTRLREAGNDAHVLILTARDNMEDRLRGLRSGADDYLVKPFSFEELLARVQALVRRKHGRKNPRIKLGTLEIDTVTRSAQRNGEPLSLGPRDYALLEYLALRAGEVVTRSEIEEHLYDGRRDIASNAVDSAICTLRRRIDAGEGSSFIETRRGHGYVLREK